MMIGSKYTCYHLGDPSACVALAHCYTHGKGVEKSNEDAFRFNMQAAEMGVWIHLVVLYYSLTVWSHQIMQWDSTTSVYSTSLAKGLK